MSEQRMIAGLSVRIDGPAAAPWVTLLHSLATHSDLWAPQVAALQERFRILRVDFPGHGASPAPDGPLTVQGLVAQVVVVWDALGIERSHVAGLSLGGMTALELGLAAPPRIGALVAADCRADAPEFFRNLWNERQAIVRQAGMGAIVEPTLASWLTPQTRTGRPTLVAEVEAMIVATSAPGYLAATAALQGLDVKPRLARMTARTWFVCGDADGPHPAEMRSMAEATPGSAYVEIAGAAHLANLEQPDAFNAALLAALEAVA